MRAYSTDLRERILRAVDEGKPRAQIIELLNVSRATIKRYLKQRRETGDLHPQPIPGRTPKKGAALLQGIGELLQERPDARLEDYCQMWESRHSRHSQVVFFHKNVYTFRMHVPSHKNIL